MWIAIRSRALFFFCHFLAVNSGFSAYSSKSEIILVWATRISSIASPKGASAGWASFGMVTFGGGLGSGLGIVKACLYEDF